MIQQAAAQQQAAMQEQAAMQQQAQQQAMAEQQMAAQAEQQALAGRQAMPGPGNPLAGAKMPASPTPDDPSALEGARQGIETPQNDGIRG